MPCWPKPVKRARWGASVNLASFQADFATYLCGASATPPVSSARANVYRNNVRLSLSAALAANFPVTEALVGAEFFAQAARQFLRDHLPDRPEMAAYGAAFPGFLVALPELAAYPFVPDVARVERAMIEALLAPDAPRLTADAFSAIPPDAFASLRFAAHPSTRLVRAAYAVADLWAAHQDGLPDLTALDPFQPQAMLIARPDDRVEWRALAPSDAIFLDQLLSGAPIDAAIGPLPEDFDLTAALLIALQAGVFTGLILAD